MKSWKGKCMIKFQGKRTTAVVAASLLTISSLALGAPAQANTEVTFWGPTQLSGGVDPYVAVAEAFNKSQNKYTVKIESKGGAQLYGQALNTAIQAKALPDVFMVEPGVGQLQSLLPLARAGIVLPLNNTNAPKRNPATDRQFLNLGTTTYGAAFDVQVTGVVVNTTAMRKDGVVWPKTFSRLLTECRAAVARGKSFFYLAGSQFGNNGLMAQLMLVTTVYGQDPTWNSKRTRGTVKFATDKRWQGTLNKIKQMNDAGCFQKGVEAGNFPGISQNLFAGRAYGAFVPGGTAADYRRQSGQIFDNYPFPVSDKISEQRVLYGASYAAAINKDAKNVAGARAFINYIVSPAGQTAFTKVSGALKNDLTFNANVTPWYRPIASLVLSKKVQPSPTRGWTDPAVYNRMGTGIQGIFTGQATVQDVLNNMDAAWK
jgi:raffinose/stachyose/melibiose transport system substrate-binding protein